MPKGLILTLLVLYCLTQFAVAQNAAVPDPKLPQGSTDLWALSNDERDLVAKMTAYADKKDEEGLRQFIKHAEIDHRQHNYPLSLIGSWLLYQCNPAENAAQFLEAYPVDDVGINIIFSDLGGKPFGMLEEWGVKGDDLAIEKIFGVRGGDGAVAESYHDMQKNVFLRQPMKAIRVKARLAQESEEPLDHAAWDLFGALEAMNEADATEEEVAALKTTLKEARPQASAVEKQIIDYILSFKMGEFPKFSVPLYERPLTDWQKEHLQEMHAMAARGDAGALRGYWKAQDLSRRQDRTLNLAYAWYLYAADPESQASHFAIAFPLGRQGARQLVRLSQEFPGKGLLGSPIAALEDAARKGNAKAIEKLARLNAVGAFLYEENRLVHTALMEAFCDQPDKALRILGRLQSQWKWRGDLSTGYQLAPDRQEMLERELRARAAGASESERRVIEEVVGGTGM